MKQRTSPKWASFFNLRQNGANTLTLGNKYRHGEEKKRGYGKFRRDLEKLIDFCQTNLSRVEDRQKSI